MGNSGSAVKVCTDHQGGINWLSLSPDGQRLLTGSEDGTARLWSTADSQCHGHFQGHESYITFCHLENEAAFTCSADHTIRKWDVVTGQCLAIYRGHTSIVNRILVAKDYLFSGSYDRTARCWSVDKEKQIQEFRGHRNCVLTLAHYSSRDVLEEEEEEEEEEEKVSRDLLVTGSTDCTVKGAVLWQHGLHHQDLEYCHWRAAESLQRAPRISNLPRVFTGSGDACARAFNSRSGVLQKIFRGHKFIINCIQIHNELLYTASHDGTLRIWDIRGICKRNKRRLKKERSVQGRSSQKGSLSRLFNNKVGCMVQQENGEHEAVELM
ncbi:WD repeat-containing protein 86 isoform X4 [Aphelocoma coerulescens]|uniref:WD repeat-containing protein 86 isoform X4 n=1 Tax=Aphelocoma coerulescens TaxID=39617 RepID=UPI00360438E6